MRVQRVAVPDSAAESWTVLGDDQVPVEPIEQFLAYLASIRRAPNTVKAYAHDSRDWFTYLSSTGRDWLTATVEDVAMFVAWLRLPPATRHATVTVLPSVARIAAFQRQPKARGFDVVLRVPRPSRGEAGRAGADAAAGSKPLVFHHVVPTVSAPHHHERQPASAHDQACRRRAASADPHGRAGSVDPRCVRASA